MVPRLNALQRRAPRATLLGLSLIVIVPLAAWLSYEAVTAARSHRQTAEAVLRDYASIAATELAREVRVDIDDLLDDVFAPVRRRFSQEDPLPPPAVAGWNIGDALRDEGCDCPTIRRPLAFFSWDGRSNLARSDPDTLTPDLVRQLAEDIAQRRPDIRRRGNGIMVRSVEGAEPVAVAYTLWRDSVGATNGVLGFITPISAISELIAESYDDRTLLPEPISRGRSDDSLVVASAWSRDSIPLYTSRAEHLTSIAASQALGLQFDSIALVAAVRADAAGDLIIGGLPQSRLPLLLTLLVVTVAVVGVSFVQLGREREFQRLRDNFVSGVSHELRTPLAQIRMFAELQEGNVLTEPQDQARAIGVIHREARRLSYLVDNILQFSRLSRSAGIELPVEPIDLSEAVSEGVDAMRSVVEERGMKLEVVPQPGALVLANREAVTRIVVNFIDNAVKYGAPGQTVTLRVGVDSDRVELSASDEGPGIPERDRDRVWEPYQRLERDEKARLPGTGIGLAVVRDLAVALGGTVVAGESIHGGARLAVSFPAHEGAEGAGTENREGDRVA